ncbi:hypothetical protein Tco_0602266 [Tanacetum coccineum]
MICNESWKKHDASLVSDINNKSSEINDLEAQLQEKSILVNELKQLLTKLKGKSQVTQCKTANLNSRSQILKDENVSLEFQVSCLVKEREHLKLVYKNLYDSIKQTQAQTKRKTNSLQEKLNEQISKNAKLKAQLQAKISEQNNELEGCKDSPLFIGTVRFGNDHFTAIMRYDDLQIGNILISRVYYVEGIGHYLFFIGKFCDSDLEVAFKKHICFVRNLVGVDLLSGSCGSNLYTISLEDMMKSLPICLLSKDSKTKSWLCTEGHLI